MSRPFLLLLSFLSLPTFPIPFSHFTLKGYLTPFGSAAYLSCFLSSSLTSFFFQLLSFAYLLSPSCLISLPTSSPSFLKHFSFLSRHLNPSFLVTFVFSSHFLTSCFCYEAVLARCLRFLLSFYSIFTRCSFIASFFDLLPLFHPPCHSHLPILLFDFCLPNLYSSPIISSTLLFLCPFILLFLAPAFFQHCAFILLFTLSSTLQFS